MKNDRLGANVLSALLIPNVDAGLAASLELKPHHRSLGIVTSDCDDVTYVALDEATKAADVEVVYARSMYAGAGNDLQSWLVKSSVFWQVQIRKKFVAA